LLHLLGGEAALLAATVAPAIAAMLLSLSPASRAQENKINASDPGVASRSESGLTPGYSLSRLQRENAWLPRVVQVAAIAGVVLAIVGVVSAVKYGAFRVKPGTTKAMRNQMDAAPGSHIVQTGLK